MNEIVTQYKPLDIDHQNKTIMGVDFGAVDDFDSAVNALGSVMYEGYDPTPHGIMIIRDYISGKITLDELIKITKRKEYV
jgi:putative transcriptional regulator